MTDEELLSLNAQGIIPGPLDTEESLKQKAASLKAKALEQSALSQEEWAQAHQRLQALFDCKPVHLPAFYSNRSLTPWQAAASWIENGQLVAIQLRESLRNKSYFGYQKEEILAHEAVHAARSGFHEMLFEEFFAYRVCKNKWRQTFGPLLRKPWEAWPFLFFLIAGIVTPLFYIGALGWLTGGLIRLYQIHRRFKRASSHLLKWVKDPQKVLPVLFRLTDAEITQFARGKNLELYASKQQCLRWRLIKLAYMST